MDELLTKEELINGIRRRDKYQNKAKKGAIASAMLASGAVLAKSAKHPIISGALAVSALPTAINSLNNSRLANKYKKVVKNNKELYKLDQLEYGQLNHR